MGRTNFEEIAADNIARIRDRDAQVRAAQTRDVTKAQEAPHAPAPSDALPLAATPPRPGFPEGSTFVQGAPAAGIGQHSLRPVIEKRAAASKPEAPAENKKSGSFMEWFKELTKSDATKLKERVPDDFDAEEIMAADPDANEMDDKSFGKLEFAGHEREPTWTEKASKYLSDFKNRMADIKNSVVESLKRLLSPTYARKVEIEGKLKDMFQVSVLPDGVNSFLSSISKDPELVKQFKIFLEAPSDLATSEVVALMGKLEDSARNPEKDLKLEDLSAAMPLLYGLLEAKEGVGNLQFSTDTLDSWFNPTSGMMNRDNGTRAMLSTFMDDEAIHNSQTVGNLAGMGEAARQNFIKQVENAQDQTGLDGWIYRSGLPSLNPLVHASWEGAPTGEGSFKFKMERNIGLASEKKAVAKKVPLDFFYLGPIEKQRAEDLTKLVKNVAEAHADNKKGPEEQNRLTQAAFDEFAEKNPAVAPEMLLKITKTVWNFVTESEAAVSKLGQQLKQG